MPKDEIKAKKTPFYGLLVLICCSFLALAGPSWQQKPQPVINISDDMIVILDLSLSMLAGDVTPNRLIKTKQKLQDLLKLRTEGNTALIVFSGDSHVVTPLTDDTNTIIANLSALDPFIMPIIGSRPDMAISQALDLLTQGKATNGRIILLSDGITQEQADIIDAELDGKAISLSVLTIGTEAGGPIDIPGRGYFKDEGKVIIPKADFSIYDTLAKSHGGTMTSMTLDESDLRNLDISGDKLLKQIASQESAITDNRFDSWEDMGYLFLLLIIPLALFAHRQGALILLALCIIFPADETQAFEWDDLWRTRDQQAQTLYKQGKLPEAADLFESLDHKAHAQYKSGDFEQAELNYQSTDSADRLYNQANALVQQQKFQEALEQYEQALTLDPEHEDSIFNKKIIEDLLEQQDQQNKDEQNQDQQDQDQQDKDQQDKDQQDKDQQDKDQQDKDQQDKDQQDNDQQDKDQQDKDQQDKDQQDKDQQDKDQQEELSQEEREQEAKEEKEKEQARELARQKAQEEAGKLSEEEKQSYEQWMRRVPDDPGGLLKRKFEQQSIERKRNYDRNTRRESDPIW